MAVLPASVDFTDLDKAAIVARLQALLRSVFPTWTDFSVTNFGNSLVEMFAWVGDVGAFYQNAQAREAFIPTATQRRSLLALTKLLGYVPKLTAAATTDLTISASGLAADVHIAAGQIFKTRSGAQSFQLLSPVALTAPSDSFTGSVEHSTTRSLVYAANGQPNQSVVLPEAPFLGVVSVVGSGAFSAVDNFLFSGPTDLVFAFGVNNNDVATVAFGDGVTGIMPTGNVTITYKTGGGATGNVAADSITQVDGQILDDDGNSVTLTVTNADAASGGDERETNASIRLRAPLSIRAPSRSIAREDFEIHAVEVAGVDRALMMTINEDRAIRDNSGVLYIVPSGTLPATPSTPLIQKVKALFTGDTQSVPPFAAPLTFSLAVSAPIYADIDVQATIFFRKGASIPTVKAAILSSFSNFFAPTVTDDALASELEVEVGAQNPLIDFGFYLKQRGNSGPSLLFGAIELSDLMNVVHDVPGVRGIGPNDADFIVTAFRKPDLLDSGTWTSIVIGAHTDVLLADSDFPRLGTITLINGDTGATI